MKIILGVTGSIAAYKAYDLVRDWTKKGHTVRVILSKGGELLVRPEPFMYLGAEAVYGPDDDFNLSKIANTSEKLSSVLHIELAKWCDRMVICPLSANTLSRLARGDASDLLTTVFLALDNRPAILYPAMNTLMLVHPFTQENIVRLQKLPLVFVHPTAEGTLACGNIGAGKLPDIECVADLALYINPAKTVQPKTVLITAGATVAPIDPIRYLTNASSGITGYYIARRFLTAGHKVVVVAGKNSVKQLDYLSNLPNATVERVWTTDEMAKKVEHYFDSCDVYISTAAINDFDFTFSKEKIKKEATVADTEQRNLEYKIACDILGQVIKRRKPGQMIIGFAAETMADKQIFKEKWQRKPVDWLIGNRVDNGVHGGKAVGFGANVDHNHYFFIQQGEVLEERELSKDELAEKIFDMVFNDHYMSTL